MMKSVFNHLSCCWIVSHVEFILTISTYERDYLKRLASNSLQIMANSRNTKSFIIYARGLRKMWSFALFPRFTCIKKLQWLPSSTLGINVFHSQGGTIPHSDRKIYPPRDPWNWPITNLTINCRLTINRVASRAAWPLEAETQFIAKKTYQKTLASFCRRHSTSM